jgi:hypothetical protein
MIGVWSTATSQRAPAKAQGDGRAALLATCIASTDA